MLRYGDQLVAGLGRATVLADMDFETSSEAGFVWDGGRWRGPTGGGGKKGLKVVDLINYVEHGTFRVETLYYDLKDGRGARCWLPHVPPPVDLFEHLARGLLIEAWNAQFEREVWERYCVRRLGWPAVRPEQWRCAMAKGRAHALPGSLAKAGDVLALTVRKDPDGERLLKRFSEPRDPTKDDPRLWHRPLWTPEAVNTEAATLFLHRLGLERAERQAAGKDVTPRRVVSLAAQAQQDAHEQADDSQRFLRYNRTDIESEAEASGRTPDLSPMELRFWQDDQRINGRGVQVDTQLVEACIQILEAALGRYTREFADLTGGIKPSEVAQTLAWLHTRGVHLDALDEDAVDAALRQVLPDDARRVLEVRGLAASASVKKFYALRNSTGPDGRIRYLYNFFGARTGRPTGNGAQPTNLPKAGPDVVKCDHCGRWHGAHTMTCGWCGQFTLRAPKAAREWNPESMHDAIDAALTGSVDFLEKTFGFVLQTLAGILRGVFVARPGHELISSDYTAIEGAVIACLAGEQWRIDAYANDSPMYLLSAERMFGVSVQEMLDYAKANGHHHPLRQKGKGGELACGFGGWINSLRQFGVDGSDDELTDTVLKWRAASPAVEWFWGGQKRGPADVIRKVANADRWNKSNFFYGLEGAAVSAVCSPGEWFHVRRLDETLSGVSYICQGDALYCRVPSGGLITYHRPRVAPAAQDWRGLQLSFEGWNSNPKQGPLGWVRMSTYSGKLAENVTQRTARDIQMPALARLESTGRYPVVMHTYDEIVSEVAEGSGSVSELESFMCDVDEWARGWPIKAAGGWRGKRYRKA